MVQPHSAHLITIYVRSDDVSIADYQTFTMRSDRNDSEKGKQLLAGLMKKLCSNELRQVRCTVVGK